MTTDTRIAVYNIVYVLVFYWTEQQFIRNKNSFSQAALRVPVEIIVDYLDSWQLICEITGHEADSVRG